MSRKRRKKVKHSDDDTMDWLSGSHTVLLDGYDEEFGDIFGKEVPDEEEEDIWSDDYLLMGDDDLDDEDYDD